MAKMTRLDPVPKQPLPRDGWELIATEAGRYAVGLRATVQIWNGHVQAVQQLSLAKPETWAEFISHVATQLEMDTTEPICQAVMILAAGVEGVLRQAEQASEVRANSQATELVELADSAELFHDQTGEAYATIDVDGHQETWLIKAKGFRRWLAQQFYQAHDKAPGSQAVQDALGVLEGKALFKGEEIAVYTRLAGHEGAIYLDLANQQWQAIQITSTGWRVMDAPPVKFRRTRGMLPLPQPIPGGSVDNLQPFVNIGVDDQDEWILLITWLISTFHPHGPYPVLVLHGEQGSAKSTTSRVLRALIDPNTTPLRSEPRNAHDLIIAASNGWVVNLDNLSHLPSWLSDAICRLATGGGFSTRELYTDSDEVLFDAKRPVILNGIEELATRGDLLDRSIILYLHGIPKTERKREAIFWQQFEEARPQMLGVLLTAVSQALATVNTIELGELPRMADFAMWSAAAAASFGWDAKDFLQAYTGNREAANELTLEASPIAPFISHKADMQFCGTATQLLQDLHLLAAEHIKRQKGWPKNERSLSNALRRIAPNLRAVGIDVEFRRESGGTRQRTIRICRTSR
jgi:hypothetical protein